MDYNDYYVDYNDYYADYNDYYADYNDYYADYNDYYADYYGWLDPGLNLVVRLKKSSMIYNKLFFNLISVLQIWEENSIN